LRYNEPSTSTTYVNYELETAKDGVSAGTGIDIGQATIDWRINLGVTEIELSLL
jgi:hypothetical protein